MLTLLSESSKDDIRIHALQEKPSFSTLGTPGPSRPETPVHNDHQHDDNAGLATEFSTVYINEYHFFIRREID